MKNFTQKNIWTAVAVVVIVVLLFFIFKNKAKAPEVAQEVEGSVVETPVLDETQTEEATAKKMTLYIPGFETVVTPMGEPAVCSEKVVYTTVEVTPTRAPLAATYTKLFATDVFVKSGLSFDKAELVGDTAKVYMKGGFAADECLTKQMKAQVELSATHFSNIKNVEVYLNGTVFNWTMTPAQS